MSFDFTEFRQTLGCFTTGICIVTCRTADNSLHGVTVNSFASVSLDPPLVLFSLDQTASTFEPFMAVEHFAINVLSKEQLELSRVFAERAADRWNGVQYETWDTGAPILPCSLATLECKAEARHQGGDHIIMVGRVLRLARRLNGNPLLYFRGRYQALSTEE